MQSVELDPSDSNAWIDLATLLTDETEQVECRCTVAVSDLTTNQHHLIVYLVIMLGREVAIYHFLRFGKPFAPLLRRTRHNHLEHFAVEISHSA
jgi:hypothetical protein